MSRPRSGGALADLSRSLFSLAVMVGLGLLVGFRFHSTTPRILAGMALIIAFGYAFSWMYAAIGLATRDPETAQIAGILPFFVLMFASNAVVPVDTHARLAATLRPQSTPQRYRLRRPRPPRRRARQGTRALDEIIVLEQGRMAERGYADLITSDGHFAGLLHAAWPGLSGLRRRA